MTNTEKAIKQVQSTTAWHFDDLQILNEEQMEWIARATTTHRTARGEPEVSFIIIGEGQRYVHFEISTLPKLADWIKAGIAWQN